MLVVVQVCDAPVWQFGEPLDCAVVGIALKFNRADETATGAGFKPEIPMTPAISPGYPRFREVLKRAAAITGRVAGIRMLSTIKELGQIIYTFCIFFGQKKTVCSSAATDGSSDLPRT